jgi:hypothetical protein
VAAAAMLALGAVAVTWATRRRGSGPGE